MRTPSGSARSRNIPAHAGKTLVGLEELPEHQEHPRARGENFELLAIGYLTQGTSPRTRGKLQHLNADGSDVRNIPAHAGKTIGRAACPFDLQEHPRARGENKFEASESPCTKGTSPRTRGKLKIVVMIGDSTRNIPAHAGKTNELANFHKPFQEHPRARGENFQIPVGGGSDFGTSPRTRGKPDECW